MDPKVSELKDKGNSALQADRLDEAIQAYTEAIEIDSANEILFSNRSAAYAKNAQYDKALQDAEKAVEVKPAWGKGYSRKGAALSYLKRHSEAIAAYEEGLKHDPGNQQLKDGLAEARNASTAGPRGAGGFGGFPGGGSPFGGGFPSGGGGGFPNPFGGPEVMDKLRNDPRTREFANEPGFQNIIRNMQANPSSFMNYLGDPRISKALSVLLGIDLSSMGGGAGADDDVDMEDSDANPFSTRSQSTPTSGSTPAPKKPDPKERPKGLSAEQQKAWDEKDLGNEAYKKKDFETALKHYETAIELDPTNVTYQTNKAAAFFEQGKYEECIEICTKAIDIGRENRADYQLIAKAFSRIGNAYSKLGDNKNAKIFFEKSLAEHRDPAIVKRVQEIDKQIKEEQRKADVNPALAEEEKNKGNEQFKKGDYPGALKHYSEAIKRNPTDAKLYSNRAAAYTKLLEFNLGLKDCEECIKMDPSFVKAYIRKASILMAMKQPGKAAHAYEKALELEPGNQEAREGMAKITMENQRDPEAARKQAMEDPEIQEIIGDPAMRMILEQMQKDPRAVRDHLKDPQIAARIEKLIAAGLIGMR